MPKFSVSAIDEATVSVAVGTQDLGPVALADLRRAADQHDTDPAAIYRPIYREAAAQCAQLRAQNPAHRVWQSVSTPSVFAECELPENSDHDTPADAEARDHLADLAERHGAHVETTGYPRG